MIFSRTHRCGLSALKRALLVLLPGAVLFSASAAPQPVLDEYSSPYIRSLSLAAVTQEGRVQLVASFELAEGYHVYWKNPGDTGLAPKFRLLNTDSAYTLGDIDWPIPSKILVGPLLNYGYSHKVDYRIALLADNAPVADSKAITEDLIIDARWLVCHIECVPEQARLRYRPAQAPIADTHSALSVLPSATPLEWSIAEQVPAQFTDPGVVAIALGQWPLPGVDASSAIDWHLAAEDPGLIEPASPQSLWQEPSSGRWFLMVETGTTYSQLLSANTATARPFKALLMALGAGQPDESGALIHYYADPNLSRVVFVYPPVAGAAPGSPLPEKPILDGGFMAWLWAIIFAFVGGVLLNAMPCVFPVLSIKLISIAELLRTPDTRRLFVSAICAQTAGVLVAMLSLASILLLLRGADDLLAWGFQLQSPVFVLVIGALMLLVGLNLSGVFEVNSGAGALANIGTGSTSVLTKYFLSGLLVVLLASPCTAPFMVTAFSYAWQQPYWLALSVFVFLGLGLAAPYLALIPFPGLGRHLPAPGAWMQDLQRLLAFPIYAAVLWLVWVMSRQTDAVGLAWVLLVLWGVGFVAWYFGRFIQRPHPRRATIFVALVLVVAMLGFITPATVAYLSDQADVQSGQDRPTSTQAWSPERALEIRQSGQALLINFTAAWCATCIWNESRVFSRDEFVDVLATTNTAYLIADWTNHDENIARALAEQGRFSVPTYMYYPPGAQSEVVLLDQLPALDAVISMLEQ